MTLPALLTPTWMDPQAIIQGTGAAALWIVALIAFAECGLAVFFMPGDSLLFLLWECLPPWALTQPSLWSITDL
ncbi:DedA protein [Cutibacterium acnes JCM 18918]|nr:DedA protein [Cutibacterium acnes JCM 18918]